MQSAFLCLDQQCQAISRFIDDPLQILKKTGEHYGHQTEELSDLQITLKVCEQQNASHSIDALLSKVSNMSDNLKNSNTLLVDNLASSLQTYILSKAQVKNCLLVKAILQSDIKYLQQHQDFFLNLRQPDLIFQQQEKYFIEINAKIGKLQDVIQQHFSKKFSLDTLDYEQNSENDRQYQQEKELNLQLKLSLHVQLLNNQHVQYLGSNSKITKLQEQLTSLSYENRIQQIQIQNLQNESNSLKQQLTHINYNQDPKLQSQIKSTKIAMLNKEHQSTSQNKAYLYNRNYELEKQIQDLQDESNVFIKQLARIKNHLDPKLQQEIKLIKEAMINKDFYQKYQKESQLQKDKNQQLEKQIRDLLNESNAFINQISHIIDQLDPKLQKEMKQIIQQMMKNGLFSKFQNETQAQKDKNQQLEKQIQGLQNESNAFIKQLKLMKSQSDPMLQMEIQQIKVAMMNKELHQKYLDEAQDYEKRNQQIQIQNLQNESNALHRQLQKRSTPLKKKQDQNLTTVITQIKEVIMNEAQQSNQKNEVQDKKDSNSGLQIQKLPNESQALANKQDSIKNKQELESTVGHDLQSPPLIKWSSNKKNTQVRLEGQIATSLSGGYFAVLLEPRLDFQQLNSCKLKITSMDGQIFLHICDLKKIKQKCPNFWNIYQKDFGAYTHSNNGEIHGTDTYDQGSTTKFQFAVGDIVKLKWNGPKKIFTTLKVNSGQRFEFDVKYDESAEIYFAISFHQQGKVEII